MPQPGSFAKLGSTKSDSGFANRATPRLSVDCALGKCRASDRSAGDAVDNKTEISARLKTMPHTYFPARVKRIYVPRCIGNKTVFNMKRHVVRCGSAIACLLFSNEP